MIDKELSFEYVAFTISGADLDCINEEIIPQNTFKKLNKC